MDSRPIKYKIVIADDHALVRGGLELVVKMAVPNAEIFQANSFDETINALNSNFSIDTSGSTTPNCKNVDAGPKRKAIIIASNTIGAIALIASTGLDDVIILYLCTIIISILFYKK